MTITEFLLARIAEDEAAAKAVPPLDHNFDMGGNRQDERFTHGRYLPDSMDGRGNWAKVDQATPAHFGRWDPARVLAECEAKRRIVDLHSGTAPWCGWTHDAGSAHGDDMGDDCDTMRALASVYADHPDYREEWRA